MDQILEQLLGYARGIWRRRWYVVGVAWVLAAAGWGWVYSLPDEYRATARVYVDTQSLLSPLLGGMTIQPRVDQRLEIMTRTLLSRPNLEEVARRTDLDLRAETPKQMEAIINDLEQNLRLSGSSRQNLYHISYDSTDPQLARAVVQSLLNIFVERGLGTARQDLDTSQRFIDQQIAQYKERLSRVEDEIKQFKRENGALLPDDGSDYYARLEQARQRYEAARLKLNEAISRRDTYKARLSGSEPTLLEPAPKGESVAALDARIGNLQERLDELRLRYTEEYPDVQATKAVIENLKEQRQQMLESQRNTPEDFSGDAQVSNYLQQMQFALAQAESEVASLRERTREYRQRLEELEQQVNRIPDVQAEYNELTERRKRLKDTYEKLLATREKAQMSERVESQTQSVDFRIVDPPYVPSSPVAPDRVMLASAVLLLGVAAGTGLALLLSQLRRTIDTRRTLRVLTNRPLLGTVSFKESPERARRRRLGYVAYGGSVALLFMAYGALIVAFTSG